MTGRSIAERLPELMQIEAIIRNDHKEYLSSKILGNVPYNSGPLPIYA